MLLLLMMTMMRSAVWFLCCVAFFCLGGGIRVDCDVSSICDVSKVAFFGVLILFFLSSKFIKNEGKNEITGKRVVKKSKREE